MSKAGTASPKPSQSPPDVDAITAAEAKVAEAETRVRELTQAVFVDMLTEQREIQARIDQARREGNNVAYQEARSALDAAKGRRNAAIDALEGAKAAVALASGELGRLGRARRRQEMLTRAEALATASVAELLEEQRQLPRRLAEASRDLDVEQVDALRRRLDELPRLLYGARLLEAGRAAEELRAKSAVEVAAADALTPELEAAEERWREATVARDAIAQRVNWHRMDAEEALRQARERDRQVDNIIAEAFRAEAPVVRSLSHSAPVQALA